MTKQKIVGVSFTQPIFDELERVRGDVPRSTYIVRVLEKDFKSKEGQED